MIRALCHQLLRAYYGFERRRFFKALENPEAMQRQRLRRIVGGLKRTQLWGELDSKMSYEALSLKIPVRNYEDYQASILKQKDSGALALCAQVSRFEPTSGATHARKWIPYPAAFLNEINRAAQVWISDLYHRYPQTCGGTHYWSLSWLPHELRGESKNDEDDLFPFYQRWILKNTRAVPGEIANLTSPESAWWATLVLLAAREDLTLVSVWSPTFWLKITQDIHASWPEIQDSLQRGEWTRHADVLTEALGKPRQRELSLGVSAAKDRVWFFKALWPRLSLISAWDSASSTHWANEIRREFPNVGFQGKGVWATEGVVTIPLGEEKVLAVNSHFFEFRDLKTGGVFPAWKLELGHEYQPILWTSSGLLRYALQDRLRVTGFHRTTPCFEFVSRLMSVDFVGEKIDAAWVQQLLDTHPEWKGICLIGVPRPQPHYVLMYQAPAKLDGRAAGNEIKNEVKNEYRNEIQTDIEIEECLLGLHHYRLARELGQLGRAQTRAVTDIFEVFEKLGRSRILGQNKIEVLTWADLIEL